MSKTGLPSCNQDDLIILDYKAQVKVKPIYNFYEICMCVQDERSTCVKRILVTFARLYRTGQQHVVRVFLLLLKDSIESCLWGNF